MNTRIRIMIVIIALLVIALAYALSKPPKVVCGPECDSGADCGAPCPDSGADGGTPPDPRIVDPDAEPPTFPSGVWCDAGSDCVGGDNPADPTCSSILINQCDVAAHRCKGQLKAGKQCGKGYTKACTSAGILRGVIKCNPTTCDWPACVSCGQDGAPCCAGGCEPGLTCRTASGLYSYDGDGGTSCKP